MVSKALQNALTARSRADNWPDAAAEWRIRRFFWTHRKTTCVCGTWIKDVAYLRNTVNGTTVRTGASCAGHIIRVSHDRLLDALGLADPEWPVTRAEVDDAVAAGYIRPQDAKSYAEVMKRVAQDQQLRARSLARKISTEQKVLLQGRQYLWWRPTWHRATRSLAV